MVRSQNDYYTQPTKEISKKATKCWICGDKLVTDKGHQDYEKKQPVRDHCHFTGKYRGSAHNECNLQFRKPKFTPIFFHNFYLGMTLICSSRTLARLKVTLKCIPNNEERYISFSKDIKVYSYTRQRDERWTCIKTERL